MSRQPNQWFQRGFNSGSRRLAAQRETTAYSNGYDHGIHGGQHNNPYREGKVFGADLHQAWERGFKEAQYALALHVGRIG